MLDREVEMDRMRNSVVAVAFVVFGVPAASASDMRGRLFTPETATISAKTAAAVSPAMQTSRSPKFPVIREAADIPIIPLPKSLRPTRPPAGSPL
jgi:hypothetical protein